MNTPRQPVCPMEQSRYRGMSMDRKSHLYDCGVCGHPIVFNRSTGELSFAGGALASEVMDSTMGQTAGDVAHSDARSVR
jgi:hypothetical protein